ncbi:MAG: efflux RND transporter periplasmic adaptor subunit [Phycisphaerales bacterium]
MTAAPTTPSAVVAPAAPPARSAARKAGFPWVKAIAGVGLVGGTAWVLSLVMTPVVATAGVGKDLHQVEVGSFNIVIPVSGELAAVRQVEIRNKLESRAVITEIVDEGTQVQAGDVLVRLADEDIKQRILDAEDKVKNAQSDLIAAEQNLEIKRSSRESELEKADLAIELATLALKAWEEGEVVKKREDLAIALKTAEINAARLRRKFEEAERLVEQEFLSRDQYEQDRIQMIEGDAAVRKVELEKFLYENFQIRQEEAKNRSDVEQAQAERVRVEQRNDAELIRIQADVDSRRFSLQTAKDRLADLQRQLDQCTIVAPIGGLLVYASSIQEGRRGGGGETPPPSVGTELRPNELVAILPDTSEMIALLKVSEALSGRIQSEQPVTVFSDSLPNIPLRGTVQSVSVLAESGGWRDPNRRDYTVRVLIEADTALGLKPAMRCRGEIMLDRVEDQPWVPIQSVFREGPIAYVHVAGDAGIEQRQVTLGRSGELQVEVKKGVEAGDRVLTRRPNPDEIAVRIPSEVFEAARKAPEAGEGMGRPRGASARSGAPGAGGPPAGVRRTRPDAATGQPGAPTGRPGGSSVATESASGSKPAASN